MEKHRRICSECGVLVGPDGLCSWIQEFGHHAHERLRPEDLEPEEIQAILLGTRAEFARYRIGRVTYYQSLFARYPNAQLCCLHRVERLVYELAQKILKQSNQAPEAEPRHWRAIQRECWHD